MKDNTSRNPHDRPFVGENINSMVSDGEGYEDDFEDGDGGM